MEQYVKVERRYQKLERIHREVVKLASLVNRDTNTILFDVEYPRGYSGSVDGFVTLIAQSGVTINDLSKKNLLEAIADEPPLCEGGRDVHVEIEITPSGFGAAIIFRVPDIWVWEDRPSFSEHLKSQGQEI